LAIAGVRLLIYRSGNTPAAGWRWPCCWRTPPANAGPYRSASPERPAPPRLPGNSRTPIRGPCAAPFAAGTTKPPTSPPRP